MLVSINPKTFFSMLCFFLFSRMQSSFSLDESSSFLVRIFEIRVNVGGSKGCAYQIKLPSRRCIFFVR
jgi:hypothetical protein